METYFKPIIRFFTNRGLVVPHSVALAVNVLALRWVGVVAILALLAVVILRERILGWVNYE
jgi:hypothetical protein